MRKIVCILSLLVLMMTGSVFAQSPVAKFIFEDAEAAFAKQDYKTTLAKLDEAEKEFGKINPPILYLRIMARYELLKANPKDFDTVERLRKETAWYLKEYGNLESVQDKAREVYRVSAELKKYPTRLAHIENLMSQRNYREALRYLQILEEEEGKLTEPAQYLKIVALYQIIDVEEYYSDAERARALEKEVQAYLQATAKEARPNADHARHVKEIKANLAGLEDYLQGKHFSNVLKDNGQALVYFQKAAEQGSPMGMNGLGGHYKFGEGVPQDYAVARTWYEKAAQKGLARAMFGLGLLYHDGQGVTQDYATARQWYEKAAEKGNADAMFQLGWMYDQGQGVTQSYATAIAWYKKAAEKGNPDAMNTLGVIYDNGQGVAQNSATAKIWFEKAAEKGEHVAMRHLGLLYRYGRGVKKDYTIARDWFEKAATLGHVEAMVNLAEIYEEGEWLGLKRDPKLAQEWRNKAAAAGKK